MPRHPNLIDVRILNSENNTFYFFALREDRIRAFYQWIAANRRTAFGAFIPGISGHAIEGLKCIFSRPPDKFPAMDILNWLRNEQKTYLGDYPNPTITVQEIEYALEQFRLTAAPLYQDGSGDEIEMEPNVN